MCGWRRRNRVACESRSWMKKSGKRKQERKKKTNEQEVFM